MRALLPQGLLLHLSRCFGRASQGGDDERDSFLEDDEEEVDDEEDEPGDELEDPEDDVDDD